MTKSRIMAAVGLCAVVAACSNAPVVPVAPTPSGARPTAGSSGSRVYSLKDLVVGYVSTGSRTSWAESNDASFKDSAMKDGITLKTYDSGNQLSNQISGFNQFINDPSVNVIVLSAVSTTGYDQVLKAARDAGKLVIVEDRAIEADQTLYYAYVGPDFEAEGQRAAKAMCDLFDAKGKSTARVVEIGGDQSSAATGDRHKGFTDGAAACVNVKMSEIDDQNASAWDPAQARTIMDGFLKKYPGAIDGVFGANDELAIAGIQSAQAAGIKPGTGMVFVGVDATSEGFAYLINGTLSADVECSPLLAPQVFDAAVDGLNGISTLPKSIATQETVFFASEGATALNRVLAVGPRFSIDNSVQVTDR